ncbi:MAG: ATP-binding cassette domain-containing protein [Burkholderiales bacterium]
MIAPLLRMRGLRKAFGERVLFEIAELAIEAGGAYALVGPNGSGKTTLMRILAGLDRDAAGSLSFRGEDVSFASYPEHLRHAIVYVHQHPYLFRTSLRHNLGYGLRCRGVPAPERARRIDAAIVWAGLDARRATPPAKLSGGEKQRAALARARALEPELLLLDEPTSNLDREGRAQTLALLAQLRDEKRTVIVACHDQEIIALRGFARLRLEDGRIDLQSG